MPAPFDDPQGPNPQDIHAALDRICASGTFGTSPKLTSFLRFMVEATLSAHGGRLKGYTVGVEALGRSANFNPQIDPIVRVEAIRLRAALARYYSGDGVRDPVVIEMPRGHYVTLFRWRQRGRHARSLVWAIHMVLRVLGTRIVFQAPPDLR
jgi:hypothetical protein